MEYPTAQQHNNQVYVLVCLPSLECERCIPVRCTQCNRRLDDREGYVPTGPIIDDDVLLNFNRCLCPECLGVLAVTPLLYGDN